VDKPKGRFEKLYNKEQDAFQNRCVNQLFSHYTETDKDSNFLGCMKDSKTLWCRMNMAVAEPDHIDNILQK
jgi:hypothetical protein